tara:strand:- start:127 stop:519 length:393 start_codon:yes stop_codon:yes gene_type:complete
MIDYKKIAGMGENRKKKKPKVKTKKDKSSIKIKEVNPFTKAKKVTKKGEPDTIYIEPGKINRPGPTGLARKKGRSVDFDFGFSRGDKYDSEIKEVSKALKDKKTGGGKVKSKFFTGGTINPSFGGEFDDR